MDKTVIRNFAIWARNKLRSDVAYRAGLMGITAEGIADKLPQSTNSVEFYDIGTSEPYQISGKEIAQRSNLAFLIKRKAKLSDYATAYTSIIEEVAYTWFNRLIAVRFMEVNDYLPSHIRVLSSESGKIEPDIVTNPFDADLGLTETESSKILEFKQNNDADELFKLIFIKQCNKLSDILPRLFEKTDDYTELLFNCSYVDLEGIVYRLTHDIPEEDFDIDRGGQVEIIGWLYQYYNAELKDDTFALLKKNVKITKERIPSATQLFTPDWIVRYMVENSLGRLWTEGHADTSLQLRGSWKYYLEEAEQEPEVQALLNDIRKEYAKLRPEDIKFIDPCMGSGHILVYAFDVLMQIYESEGYSQREAAIQILENNIYGLDIDDRAAQLAYFAVMMKARQYNRRILDGTHDCHVLAIQESNGMSTLQTYLAPFGALGDAAFRLINVYNDAKEYGSILKIPLTLDEIDELEKRLEDINSNRSDDVEELMVEAVLLNEFPPLLEQARIMVQKYDVVVTNPPYMGNKSMTKHLQDYIEENYKTSEGDLSTVFMDSNNAMCKAYGYWAMINIPVWMFSSTYSNLREFLIKNSTTVNLLHLGRGVFGADFGTVSFVFRSEPIRSYRGVYKKMFDKQSEVENIEDKEKRFFTSSNVYSMEEEKFLIMPNNTFAYWAASQYMRAFSDEKPLSDYSDVKKGTTTGDDNRFLRLWYEVLSEDISLINHDNRSLKWHPFNKGGDFRRWYGNNNFIVNWENDGYLIKNNRLPNGKLASRPQNIAYFYRPGITWTYISISTISFRFYPSGFAFAAAGPAVFPNDDSLIEYLTGFLNSKVAQELVNFIGGTGVTYETGEVSKIPTIIDTHRTSEVETIVNKNIDISKSDWDSFETSWDFKKHPLI